MGINWKRVAKIFRARAKSFADDWCDGFDAGRQTGWNEGAAAAFGLMGMAMAINERERRRAREADDAAYERAMAKLQARGWKCPDCARACEGGEGWCRACSPEKFE